MTLLTTRLLLKKREKPFVSRDKVLVVTFSLENATSPSFSSAQHSVSSYFTCPGIALDDDDYITYIILEFFVTSMRLSQ